MPARSASAWSASGNATLSISIRNAKTSPPLLQPKQCQICRSGLTVKDGVFSAWNGQSPFQVRPARRSGTRSPITCAMSIAFRTSSLASCAVLVVVMSAERHHRDARSALPDLAEPELLHERVPLEPVLHP